MLRVAAAPLWRVARGAGGLVLGRNQCHQRSRGPKSPRGSSGATGRTTAARPVRIGPARCHRRSSHGLRRQGRRRIPGGRRQGGHRSPRGNKRPRRTRQVRGSSVRRRHPSGSNGPVRVETVPLDTPGDSTRAPHTRAASPPAPCLPVDFPLAARLTVARLTVARLTAARPPADPPTVDKGLLARDNPGNPATPHLPSRESSLCGP